MTQKSVVLKTTPPFPGPEAVAAINDANQALGSGFAGAVDPAGIAGVGPYFIWNDTGTGRRKMRNAANSAWIDIGGLEDVTPTETLPGSPLISTQAQANLGVDDETMITPKKMRFGVSVSLTTPGYLVLPTWLGNIIFQWGSSGGTGSSVTFPVAFTSLWIVQCVSTSTAGPTAGNVYGVEAVNVKSTGFSPYTYGLSTAGAGAAVPAAHSMAWLAIGR